MLSFGAQDAVPSATFRSCSMVMPFTSCFRGELNNATRRTLHVLPPRFVYMHELLLV